jgi:ABC-2 type transport system ATP-binding protein
MNAALPSPLSTSAIYKSYGSHAVLKDISLSLKEGEIFGLIGLNGAGKTTLIKIMLGLADADGGEAHVFSEPSGSVSGRKNLCYLPERFQPSRYLKGNEYLSLSLSYYDRKLDAARAREEAMKLQLNPEALGAKVGTYSKGMGQKLGLVCSFLIDVPLLMLDEPMSGLDPAARIHLKDRLLQSRNEGRTVFFSSHILSDIDEICDRVGVLHDGELLFVGTPADFKQRHGDPSLERAFLKAIGQA